MIPVALITGFLGSGKTTLLRNLAERYRERGVFFLVNEFSKTDVDGRLAQEWVGPGRVRVLPGGSIFCTCLVTEFIGALSAIPESLPGVEGVVIEASGMANPLSVEKLMRETRLDGVFSLASVVCVVDPLSFPVLVQTLPNIVAQVEVADCIVLNKVDLADETQIAAAETEVRRIRPDAPLRHARYCDVDLDVFATHTLRGLEADYSRCVDPRYAELSISLEGKVDIESVSRELAAFGGDLYRVKGYLDTDARGPVLLDFASGRVAFRDAPEAPETGRLAVIVRGPAYARALGLAERLQASAQRR